MNPSLESSFIRHDTNITPITPPAAASAAAVPESSIHEADARITNVTTQVFNDLATSGKDVPTLAEISAHLPKELISIAEGYGDELTFSDPHRVIEIFTQILDFLPYLNPTLENQPEFVNSINDIKETLRSDQMKPAEDAWVSIRNQMQRCLGRETEELLLYKALTQNPISLTNTLAYTESMGRIEETLQNEKDTAQNIVRKVLLDFFEFNVFRETRSFFCQLSVQQVKGALSRLPSDPDGQNPHRNVIERWFDRNFSKNPLSEENQKADPTLAQVTIPDPGLPLFDPKLFVALHHLLKDPQLQAPYDMIRLARGLAPSMPLLKTLIEGEEFKKQSIFEQANAVRKWLSMEHPEWDQIRELNLKDLGLTQLLPDFIAMCNPKRMPNLDTLDLGENRLSILPESIGELTQIRQLLLEYNQIVALPRTILQLQQLTTLSISSNRLEDFPEGIGAFKQLTWLNLSYNRLRTVSASINDCSQLERLFLSGNRLFSLPEIKPKKLEKLIQLALENNRLTAIPASIVELKGLQLIDLDRNQLEILPKMSTAFPNLRKISLRNNPLTGQADEVLKTLAQREGVEVISTVRTT